MDVKSRYSNRYRFGKVRGLKCDPETPEGRSRTKQNFAKEADINNIMAKYLKKGVVPIVAGSPMSVDVSELGDFQSVQNYLLAVEKQFQQVPSDVRKLCDNDPGKFIDWINNPENKAEAIKKGLLPKEPPVENIPPKPDPNQPAEPVKA